jgi:hypothetical protein
VVEYAQAVSNFPTQFRVRDEFSISGDGVALEFVQPPDGDCGTFFELRVSLDFELSQAKS